MLHDELHIVCLLIYVFPLIVCKIDFTVEESLSTKTHRHLHKLRHTRTTHSHHPYISASSTVINPNNANRLESFSLNCPHVADASNKDVRIEVIWTLNETVWLKIEDGEKKIVNGESTFNKRRVAGKTVMRILLNNARYLFDYDELTGDFSMEISPVLINADIGAWQCHVTVWQPDGAQYTLTSRRRIKPGGSEQVETKKVVGEPHHFVLEKKKSQVEDEENIIVTKKQKKKDPIEKRGDRSLQQNFASFSRQTDDTVYMTRKDDEAKSIIFARNDGPISSSSSKSDYRSSLRRMDAQIDYEVDMDELPFYDDSSRTRPRSAQHYYNSSATANTMTSSYLLIVFVIIISLWINY